MDKVVRRLLTLKGSVIRRYKDDVGKDIGGGIYVHRKYAGAVVPADLLKKAVECLPKGFKYNAVVYNTIEYTIRFDEALNFDSAREPWPGNFIKIFPGGGMSKGFSPSIWHHKWMWVRDDYKGFDVQRSYDWSEKWLSKLKNPASGSMNVWIKQLAEVGLK